MACDSSQHWAASTPAWGCFPLVLLVSSSSPYPSFLPPIFHSLATSLKRTFLLCLLLFSAGLPPQTLPRFSFVFDLHRGSLHTYALFVMLVLSFPYPPLKWSQITQYWWGNTQSNPSIPPRPPQSQQTPNSCWQREMRVKRAQECKTAGFPPQPVIHLKLFHILSSGFKYFCMGPVTQHTQQVVPLTHSILPMPFLTDWCKYFDEILVS